MLVPHLKKNSGFRSNLGFVNLGNTSCTLAVRLFDANGQTLATENKAVTVLAGLWLQVDDVFAWVGAGSSEIAYAMLTPQTAPCSFWAYGSVVDNNSNDPTTIPVVVAAGPPSNQGVESLTLGKLWRVGLALGLGLWVFGLVRRSASQRDAGERPHV